MDSRAVFQLEILDPLLDLTIRSDVTAHLGVAIEQLREHFSIEGRSVRVEVRRDGNGELEGIGFFDPSNGDLLAHVTAFYLHREDASGVPAPVAAAIANSKLLQRNLQKLFS